MSVAERRLQIPVMGVMVPNGRGGYDLDKGKSEWQETTARQLAQALIVLNGGKVPGSEQEVVSA